MFYDVLTFILDLMNFETYDKSRLPSNACNVVKHVFFYSRSYYFCLESEIFSKIQKNMFYFLNIKNNTNAHIIKIQFN